MSGGGSSGRYTRSNSGMIGAMIVTVGVILAYVAFRAINRDDLVVEREAIDYLPVVQVIQEGKGMPVAYPPTLPEGSKAVDVTFDPALAWKLDTLTAEGRYIGVYQGRIPAKQWVESWIDEDADQGKDVTLDSAIADTWQTWTDADGDYGVLTELEDTVLLIFGSADEQEIRALAESLVTTPIDAVEGSEPAQP